MMGQEDGKAFSQSSTTKRCRPALIWSLSLAGMSSLLSLLPRPFNAIQSTDDNDTDDDRHQQQKHSPICISIYNYAAYMQSTHPAISFCHALTRYCITGPIHPPSSSHRVSRLWDNMRGLKIIIIILIQFRSPISHSTTSQHPRQYIIRQGNFNICA